jgi:hypothetical protein
MSARCDGLSCREHVLSDRVGLLELLGLVGLLGLLSHADCSVVKWPEFRVSLTVDSSPSDGVDAKWKRAHQSRGQRQERGSSHR